MSHQQNVTVEFYGVPRLRAGQPTATLAVDAPIITLGDVIQRLRNQFPELARDCFPDEHVADGYLFSVGGEYFVADAARVIDPLKPLYFMSADAGG